MIIYGPAGVIAGEPERDIVLEQWDSILFERAF